MKQKLAEHVEQIMNQGVVGLSSNFHQLQKAEQAMKKCMWKMHTVSLLANEYKKDRNNSNISCQLSLIGLSDYITNGTRYEKKLCGNLLPKMMTLNLY